MFITAVCVIFLIKLRWPKNKSLLCRLHNLILIIDQFKNIFSFDRFLSCISFSRSLGSHFYAIFNCLSCGFKSICFVKVCVTESMAFTEVKVYGM